MRRKAMHPMRDAYARAGIESHKTEGERELERWQRIVAINELKLKNLEMLLGC